MHLAEGWVPLPTSKLGFPMGKAMGELISKSELLWVISQPLLTPFADSHQMMVFLSIGALLVLFPLHD